MPSRQTIAKLPTRTRTSMPLLLGRDLTDGVGRGVREGSARQEALDDEGDGDGAADRDRQIGHAGGDDGEFRNALVPRRLYELDSPDHHEEVGRKHANLEKNAQHRLGRFGEKGRKDADADMQMLPVANDSGEE